MNSEEQGSESVVAKYLRLGAAIAMELADSFEILNIMSELRRGLKPAPAEETPAPPPAREPVAKRAAPTRRVDVEPRTCRREGCGREIPRVSSSGKPLKPAVYATRVYCSQRCSGLVSGAVRRKPVEALEVRTCSREGCENDIPQFTPRGDPYTPKVYLGMKYCGRACAGLVRRNGAHPERYAAAAVVPPVVEPAARVELTADARRARLEAAKAARRGVVTPIDADTVLAAVEASSEPLSVREVAMTLSGRINDSDLQRIKQIFTELVTAERVVVVRAGGVVAYAVAPVPGEGRVAA